jgi:hypothetical protein
MFRFKSRATKTREAVFHIAGRSEQNLLFGVFARLLKKYAMKSEQERNLFCAAIMNVVTGQ